jgi:hypothetical protein
MAFFGSSVIGNMLKGGAIGAGMGYASTGSYTGMAGGAVGGMAFGGFGAGIAGRMGGGIAGAGKMMARGAGMAGRQAQRGLTGVALNRLGRGAGVDNQLLGRAAGMMADKAYQFRGLAKSSERFIGQNAVKANKFGSRAAVAAGLGAASYMGSNMINSNRGY